MLRMLSALGGGATAVAGSWHCAWWRMISGSQTSQSPIRAKTCAVVRSQTVSRGAPALHCAGRWVAGRLVWLARLAAGGARGGEGDLPDAAAEAMDLAEEAARTARAAGAAAVAAAASYWAADGALQASNAGCWCVQRVQVGFVGLWTSSRTPPTVHTRLPRSPLSPLPSSAWLVAHLSRPADARVRM